MPCPLLIALLAAATASSEPDSASTLLRNVEVTATAVSPVRSSAPVQRLDRTALAGMGDAGVSDAVKRFSGVSVNDYGGLGGLKTVSVRAMGSKHTAVAYDGVPLTDAQSGDIDISRYRLDNVETVSLSTSGSDAIFRPARLYASGATLSITSRRPVSTGRPFSAAASVSTGSFGHFAPSVRLGWCPKEDWSATVSADWLRSDGRYPYRIKNAATEVSGKRRNDDISALTGEVNLNLRNVAVKGYWFGSGRGLPGSVVFYNDWAAERLKDRNAFVQGVWRFSPARGVDIRAIGKFNWTRSLYTDRNPIYPDGIRRENNTQRELYGSVGALWRPLPVLALTLVTDLSYSTLRSNVADSPLPRRTDWQTALAGSLNLKRWRVTASLLGSVVNESVKSGAAPAPLRRLSPALSASWQPIENRDFHLRASVADGMRVPTFADRYYSRIGNVNLKPERALQTNLGLTLALSPAAWMPELSLSADGYFNRVSDKIIAVPTLYVWTMRNIGLSNIGGVDINVAARFSLPAKIGITLRGAYSWQHAVDSTDGSRTKGRPLPYTAANSGSVSVDARRGPLMLSWSLTAMGERHSSFLNNSDSRMEAYTDQTLTAAYILTLRGCTLTLRGEIRNLGNVNYQVIRYYPMPGRRFMFTLSAEI